MGKARKTAEEREAFLDALKSNDDEPLDLEKNCFLCGFPVDPSETTTEVVRGVTYKYHPICFEHLPEDLDTPVEVSFAPEEFRRR